MRTAPVCVLVSLLTFAACSGGGSSDGAANPPRGNAEPGSVFVVLDTDGGGEEVVQFQLAGATLEVAGGVETQNLLPEARMLTVCEPTGEAVGLRLGAAPTADYVALHLVFVPGTGVALDAAGDQRPIAGPVDVRVPIDDALQHAAAQVSWLVVGYDAAPVTGAGAQLAWAPALRARSSGTPMTLGALAYPVVDGGELRATAVEMDDGVVEIEPLPGCEFHDENGTVYQDYADFVDGLLPDDELVTRGYLNRHGRIDVYRLCKSSAGSASRLIGRILSLDPAGARFEMRVQAVNMRSSGLQLQTPEDILVLTNGAQLERPNGSPLAFGDLAVDQLVKVRWESRLIDPNGIDQYAATLVQVPGAGGPQGGPGGPQPQWQGNVQSVDLAASVVVITPRTPAGFTVQGQSVAQIEVQIGTGTEILRQQQGGWAAIPLAEVQPGLDRVWVRGVAVGPAAIEASRLRVRAN